MAMQMLDYFKAMVLIMLVYSFSITVITYSLPDAAKGYMASWGELGDRITLEATTSEIQDSLTAQTSIPVVEVGALVFYSGNILLDLLLNFAFAIPEMVGLLVHGLTNLLSIDNYIFATVQTLASVAITIFYFISLLQLITNIRSGRLV